jgi:hypothetical protein
LKLLIALVVIITACDKNRIDSIVVKDLSNNEYGIHHGGRDFGVKTEVIFLPKSKRGVVVFTNGDNGDSLISNIIREALDDGDKILEYLY